ncbi:hypothetical protein K0M31_006269 [Melipona bicolor]|uniref:Uncharacterized protein n=1 Tax=Melipona bicolor TaxID=60889 RepID=A0AA40FU56_9HYME|nr:hypothetical protein K0M31_006269 [Melipona bicolor]
MLEKIEYKSTAHFIVLISERSLSRSICIPQYSNSTEVRLEIQPKFPKLIGQNTFISNCLSNDSTATNNED